MQFYLVLMLLNLATPSNGTFEMPGFFPTYEDCVKAGVANQNEHYAPKPGEGATRVSGFVCVHR